MKKLSIVLFSFGLFFLLGLTGCVSNNKTSGKTETKAGNVDLSNVTLKVGQTGWGSNEEALKAAGLSNTPYKVDYSVFQGGNLILEAMTSGHIDFGITSEIPPIFSSLSKNGEQSKVIAIQQSNTLQQELVVPKGSKIKTVADLKGKKVAYVNSTTAHYFLLKMLQEVGLTWKDITPVQLSTADGLTALIGGNVDALASYGNAILAAHQNGAKTLASAQHILSGNFPINVSASAIDDPAKHAAIVDYIERLNKAYNWQRKHPDEWAKIVAANTKQPFKQALETFKEGEKQRPTHVIPLSETNTHSEQDIADVFFSVKLIQGKVDVPSFWSHAFDKELAKVIK
ncbi:ABC transporter substrate-binding protein [Bacillus sp. BRMEA1]|uniref:ABC transporter substrate-binding protein n=1 Tax=Neobacillus endophyticus TaxID=2738405 RepID=UPI00156710BC|nr:ABC transporter substrate-binding protein [Neobacillus endophyticus]NRD79107.1 ABC transporter substrate-binding protein [Neobacillus endophyticus]